MNKTIPQRIAALRELMKKHKADAVIIPQTDPHQSEYIADHWQVRRYFSGFTGSAGALVVTTDKAFIWADSRYWLQAAAQLQGTGIDVMEEGKPSTPTITEWLCTNMPANSTVAIDAMVFSLNGAEALRNELNAKGIILNLDFDPAEAWSDRPSLPLDKIFIHEEKYAGESAGSKLHRILEDAKKQGADALLLSDLAEIAWTLNIRSKDVESNPVATSFLFIADGNTTIFVDDRKVTPEVCDYLKANNIATAPYTGIKGFLATLPQDVKVLVSPQMTAAAIAETLQQRLVRGNSPVAFPKACKNGTQVQGIRNAMQRDGAALVKSFMQIEKTLAEGKQLTELDVADILTHFRSQQPLYFDQSFDTIAGFGPHGAIVHYSATPETSVNITPDNLLLIDSGASYLDGTTDITRTITLGNTTPQQRTDFTLVMKGHIALAQAVFPEGTRGPQLDAFARINLWKQGLSYLHGTGHGVGHFLNVHEGPQRIHYTENPNPLMPGMITSDEPGLYRAGQYGIRCENLILTVPAMTTEFGNFYKFEILTMFPFDLSLFDTTIMTDDEIQWVNGYHTTVRNNLSPLLNDEEKQWLKEKTAPLTR